MCLWFLQLLCLCLLYTKYNPNQAFFHFSFRDEFGKRKTGSEVHPNPRSLKIAPYQPFAPQENPDQTSLLAQMVKNLPTMHTNQVRSLGQEHPLEKPDYFWFQGRNLCQPL